MSQYLIYLVDKCGCSVYIGLSVARKTFVHGTIGVECRGVHHDLHLRDLTVSDAVFNAMRMRVI
jgi:hypothetical protein